MFTYLPFVSASKFSDLGKLGRDLLEEDHKYDSKVQVKTKLDTGTVKTNLTHALGWFQTFASPCMRPSLLHWHAQFRVDLSCEDSLKPLFVSTCSKNYRGVRTYSRLSRAHGFITIFSVQVFTESAYHGYIKEGRVSIKFVFAHSLGGGVLKLCLSLSGHQVDLYEKRKRRLHRCDAGAQAPGFESGLHSFCES